MVQCREDIEVLIGWKWLPISSFNIPFLKNRRLYLKSLASECSTCWFCGQYQIFGADHFSWFFSWSKHINITSKARQLVRLPFGQFYKHASTNTIHKLYLTIVRPQPENLRPLLGYRFWDDWEHSKVCKQGVLKAVVQRHQVSGHAWNFEYAILGSPPETEETVHIIQLQG